MSMGGGGVNLGRLFASLGLDTGNLEEKVAGAVVIMKAAEDEMHLLDAAFAAGSVTAIDYAMEMQRLTSTHTNASKAVNQGTAAIIAMYSATTQASAATATFASQMNRVGAAASSGFGKAGQGANSAGYKLMVFGQLLDDLQYVGEMGLRPIINNLMQISPVIGIAAIAINTLKDHTTELGNIIQGVGEAYGLLDKKDALSAATHEVGTLQSAWEGVRRSVMDYIEGLQALAAGDDALIKKNKKTVETFLEEGDTASKKKGKATQEAIDDYGRDKFMQEATAKAIKAAPGAFKDKGGTEEFHARLTDLYKRAGKGDKNAIASLNRLTEGTDIGNKIVDAQSEEEAKAGDKDTAEFNKQNAERARIGKLNRAKAAKRDADADREFEQGLTERRAAVRRRTANRKKKSKALYDKAQKVVPGVKKMTEQAVLRTRLAGKSKAFVMNKLAAQLRAKGFSAADADVTAKKITDDADKAVSEKAVDAAMKGPRRPLDERNRPNVQSQVFSNQDVTARAQAGVSSNPTEENVKKIASNSEIQAKALMTLAAKEGLIIGVKK